MFRVRSLVVFLCLGVVLCALTLQHASSQQGALRRVTTTTEEGLNLNPSLSGDGRRIAFESTEDVARAGGTDHFRAIRADISSEPPAFVQMAGARAVSPAISQDGSRIAFAARDNPLGTNQDGNSEIFLYDGATLRQVTNTSPGNAVDRVRNGNFQPSISDDGRFIAFASNRDLVSGQNADANLEVFVYDAASQGFTQLTSSTGTVGSSDAKISGNGARIAYIRDTGASLSAQRDLVIQDRTGGPPLVAAVNVNGLALTYGRAISDDGTRVVYAAETATPNSTQVFLFDGRSLNLIRPVTFLGARSTDVPLHPTISGDGSRIAFATRRTVLPDDGGSSVDLYTFDIPTGQFARVTPTAQSTTETQATPTAEVVSSLSDDGTVIAFNFPRLLSGAVAFPELGNNSEIYVTQTTARAPFGNLTVLNGASFGNEPSSTKAVAPNSIAVGLGGALATTTEQSSRQPDGTFPRNVGGTTVTVNGRAAQIFFVSPAQVNFLVPPETEIGTAEVVVTASDGFQTKGTVSVMRAAPGVFTYSGDGRGEGVILDADTLTPGPFDPSNGQRRLIVCSTGVRGATQVVVTIGGRVVTVEAVVEGPRLPGLDEIHLLLPADLRGAGKVELFVRANGRDSNPVDIVISGEPRREAVINEVLADPPDGPPGDANHDGTRDGLQDEFVEIVNASGRDINLSNFELLARGASGSQDTLRHRFAVGTILPAGGAIVVFGGGGPEVASSNPVFGGAQVVKASTGSLSLVNSGGVVTLREPTGAVISLFTYGGTTGLNADQNQSLTRSPDITGPFTGHLAATANERAYSPGTQTNGQPFLSPAIARIEVTPPSASIFVGQRQQFTATAYDASGAPVSGVLFVWQTSNAAVVTVDQAGQAMGQSEGTAEIRAFARGVQSAPAQVAVSPVERVLTRIEVTPPTASAPASGTQQFTARALDQFDNQINGVTFTWSSSDPNIATIDAVTGLATAASPGTVTISASAQNVTGTAVFNVTAPTVVVNEVLADPPDGSDGDVNRDGTRDGSEDEFVELVNSTASAINISGWTIKTQAIGSATQTTRHTFAAGTSLPANEAIVVFGGGGPTVGSDTAAFGCAQVVKASGASGLSLTNSGMTIIVSDASGRFVTQFTYGGTTGLNADQNQSLTRSPDVTGGFTEHTAATGAAGRRFSPGTRADGTPFANCPPRLTSVQLSPPSATIGVGQSTQFTAQALDQFGNPLTGATITFASNNTSVATVDSVTVDPATGIATATVTGHALGSAEIRATATSGTDTVTSSPATVTVAFVVSAGQIVISEFRTRGPGGASDEFIEIYNPTTSSVPIGGLKIRASNNSGTTSDRVQIPSGTTLGSGCHYLVASTSYTGSVPANQSYGTGIANDGGIAITLADGTTIIDQVGMSSGSAYKEGAPLAPLASDAEQSYERKPGGVAGNGTDSNNNASDFLLNSGSSNPQNLTSGCLDLFAPTISISDATVTEGNTGTVAATFTVTLSASSAQTITVAYATSSQSPATATASTDYQATSGTVIFNPGETTKTVTVQVNGDTLVEPDETFFVNLSAPTNATPSDAQGLGTITNDDTAHLVISQVYGGGNNSGATYRNDFVEIFNGGTTTVDFAVTPYSVQYASAGTTATGNFGTNKTNLTTGTIPPGRYFLVQEAGGTTNGIALPAPDATGSIVMTATSGKVALVAGTEALPAAFCPGDDGLSPFNPANPSIADFVGYGDTAATAGHCYEGLGPAPAPSSTTADFRKAGGCVDTDQNAADFLVAPVAPRNSLSPLNDCSGGLRPEITINDRSLSEGTTPHNFTVTLSTATTLTVTVNYSTADGTATAGTDYTAVSGTLTFAPGETTKTINVPVINDTLDEPNETYFVNLSGASNGTIADGQGQGTINDNDGFASLFINNASVSEGDSGTKTLDFTVTLSPVSGQVVTVDYATADDTATAPTDYLSTTGTLTFNPGDTTKTISVTINGDTDVEPNETFFVNLTNASNAFIPDSQGQGTILDDDAPPALSINDVPKNEGNTGTTTFTFTVSLSAPARAGGVNFTVNTADGTTNPATAGSDYVAIVNGSGSIAEGQTSTTVNVTVNGDTVFEPNETFFVNVTSVTGATVTDGQGTGTITNDDAAPTITIADAFVTEGNAGTSLMTFTVTLNGTSQSAASVNYATADFSATVADGDYDATSGTLTFSPGDTTKTFTVTIHGDTNQEGDEMFLLNLSGASGAVVNDNQGLGTIFLDDPLSITSLNTTYSENFDSLSQSVASSTTPPAWTRAEAGSSANSTYTANDGSSNSGDTYSYGSGGPAERALGGLRTGSLVPTIGAFYRNDTGLPINTLQIAYTGEEWRLGAAGRTDRLDFQYSTNATSLTTGTWTDVDALDFTTPNTAGTGAKNGNDAANRTALGTTITGLNIAPGATFWLRWNDFDATGADDGLAVDDFSLTAGINTPALSIDDVSHNEGNGGPTTYTFTVSLSSVAGPGGVTFNIATQDNTATTADNDYVARSLTGQTIAAGQQTYTFDVTVNGDATIESTESFFVNVTSVTGATVADGQGTGTITNDDAAPTSADLSVSKTDSPDPVAIGNNITYTITVTNGGPDTATSAVLSESVPTNTTFRSITAPAGWTCPTQPALGGTGAISCTNPSFAVGSSVFTLVVRVGTGVADGTTISNTATISSSTSDSASGNNMATELTTVKQPLLVISQIYPGGGNAGATYTNDFIEIFNRGTTTVDFSVTPYSVQYIGATGNFSGTGAAVKTDITSGTIGPGQYFLIQGASGGASGVALPTPDAVGSIAMAASAGKVALVLGTAPLPNDDCPGDDNLSPFNPNSTVIVDFVGYGTTANCYEGPTGPAPFSTSTAGGLDPDARSTIRTSSCTDTNNNASDFSNPTTAPTARNKATTASPCPP
ncbi:MAG TPA: Calx-beta domain-containing protein [Pyrinomonadaceae bacterium]